MKNPFRFNLSYSAIGTYKSCQRQFYYSYVQGYKPEGEQITAYACAGSTVHACLEQKYFSPIEEVKELFEDMWIKKKLDSENRGFGGTLLKKDQYWNAILNGIQKRYDINRFEEKIQFDDFFTVKGYIDAVVNTDYSNELIQQNPDLYDDVMLVDWKTNSNVDEGQINQLKFYNYLWFRKYNKLPRLCKLEYIKINKELSATFDIKDVYQVADDIKQFIDEILQKKKFSDWSYNLNACTFCAYKERCNNDMIDKDEEHFILQIKNAKITFLNPLSETFRRVLGNNLSYEIDNNFFVIKRLKERGVNWDGIVRLFKNNSIPIGFLNRVIDIIRQYEEFTGKRVTYEIIDLRKTEEPKFALEKTSNIEMRWYQNEAIYQMNKKKIGIINVVTSGGKTLIAAEHYRQNPVTSLFVVDRKVLLSQTVKEFEEYMNVKCSTITEGHIEQHSNLYVATIQTINSKLKNKDKEMIGILKSIQNVYVDEAHIGKSSSYSELIKKCWHATTIIGLTGTPGEGKGKDLELTKNVGDIIYTIDAKTLIEEDTIMKPEIYFVEYSEQRFLEGDYNEIYEQAIDCIDRNQIIYDTVTKYKDMICMILVTKIRHGMLLKEEIEKLGLECVFIQGSMSNKEREQYLDEARNGNTRVLIGTSSIVSKGLNLKSLEVIINATGNATSIMTIQSLGRVLRKNENKEKAIFIDIYDTCKHLKEHTEARIQAFEKQRHEVKIVKNLGF